MSGAANGQIVTDIKTPPLQASDTITIPLAFHNPVPLANWAGSRVRIHILDASEVDVLAVIPTLGGSSTPIISPFGPQSNNAESAPMVFNAWDPSANTSGRTLPASVTIPVMDLVVHAKGSQC